MRLDPNGTFLPADISVKLAITSGIGLLVGLEREWSQKDLGIRTFAIASILGTLSTLSGAGLSYVSFGGILLIVLLSGLRSIREGKPVEATTFAAVFLKVYRSRGLYYTAVLGGMVNSTATVAELAGYLSNASGDVTPVAIRIDLLTVVAMFVRNVLILFVFARSAAFTAAGPLTAMILISSMFLWQQRKKESGHIGELKLSSPLQLSKVLKFASIFLVIEIVGTWPKDASVISVSCS